MIYAETYFDKAVDDSLEEMSRKENKTMAFKWDEPMNPYAAEDFRNAMKKASEDLSKGFKDFSEDLKRIGEQMKSNAHEGVMSFIDFDDMPTEYNGVMRLPYSPIGAWSDMVNILVANGYDVCIEITQPTETARELDGADKFVVIEYEGVE